MLIAWNGKKRYRYNDDKNIRAKQDMEHKTALQLNPRRESIITLCRACATRYEQCIRFSERNLWGDH